MSTPALCIGQQKIIKGARSVDVSCGPPIADPYLIPTFEAALLDQFRDFSWAGMWIFPGRRKILASHLRDVEPASGDS
jgi:hypothetical protein